MKRLNADINKALVTLLFFSLPFERIPSFEIYSVSIKLSTIFGIMIIIRTIYLLIRRSIKIKPNFYLWLLMAFIVWMLLLIPETIDFARAISIVAFNTFTILLAVCISLIFRREYLRPIFFAVIVSAILSSAFAFYQYIADVLNAPLKYTGLLELYAKKTFGFPRVHAFSAEPLQFAVFMMLPFTLVLSSALIKNDFLSKRKSLSLIALFSSVIFLTLSRGGIYSLIAVSFIGMTVALIGRKSDFRRTLAVIGAIAAGALICFLAINYAKTPPSDFTNGKQGAGAYVSHASDVTLDVRDTRSKARQIAFREISSNFTTLALGIGPGQFYSYVKAGLYGADSPYLNNLTLAIMLELGLLGLIIILAFFACLVFFGIKRFIITKNRGLNILLFALCLFLCAQAIQYQTYAVLYVPIVWAVAGVLMFLVADSNRKKNA